jgi:hypothetical protein
VYVRHKLLQMFVYYTMVQLVGNVLLTNHRRAEKSDNYRTVIFRPLAIFEYTQIVQ